MRLELACRSVMQNGNPNSYLNVSHDFTVINSFSGGHQISLLVNTNFRNPIGFLIDREVLFNSIVDADLQSGLEFNYIIEYFRRVTTGILPIIH